jgi:hypothetical protein
MFSFNHIIPFTQKKIVDVKKALIEFRKTQLLSNFGIQQDSTAPESSIEEDFDDFLRSGGSFEEGGAAAAGYFATPSSLTARNRVLLLTSKSLITSLR